MDEKGEDALNFIKEKVEEYERIALINSFGKDSMVVMHLVRKVRPEIPVLWIRSPFLPKETIELAEKVTKMWNLNLKVVESEFVHNKEFMENIVLKPDLPKTNPEACCQYFKVAPLMKAVRDLDLEAWFSGLRRTESEKRGKYTRVWRQGPFVKLHPILEWTEADVWRYTAVHKLPVHPWYGLGYRSLGCEPCSFPNVWTAERGGRWKDTMMEGGGCGIHETPMKKH